MMSAQPGGSVTRWIGDLKAGGDHAARPLWDRYFAQLVRLARDRLRSARRPGADADEEDAALSAFDSFCRAAARGRFPDLADRDDLWRLLVVITARKAVDQAQRRRARKRGGGRLVGEADLGGHDLLRRVLDLRLEGLTRGEIAARLGITERAVRRKLGVIRDAWMAGGGA
jgi:hypothetical protein